MIDVPEGHKSCPKKRNPRRLKIRTPIVLPENPDVLGIVLTRDKIALVDKDDYELIKHWNWSYRATSHSKKQDENMVMQYAA